MPSDDRPIDALLGHFHTEDASRNPLTRRLVEAANLLPLPWPLSKAIEAICDALTADSSERMRLLLGTCISELAHQQSSLLKLREQLEVIHSSEYLEQARDLLLDAARKAEATRAKDRIKRIAMILTRGLTESCRPNADEIEEMMRIAVDLSDKDVDHLGELVRVEGAAVRQNGRLTRYGAHVEWERCRWSSKIDPELDSIFSKLESYGLVSRIHPPNNLNITADFQNKFVLLPKGLRFTELANSAA